MTDILYIISNGFSQRMLLQTDLLGKLAQQGLKVTVVSEDRNDPVLSDYCSAKGIIQLEFRIHNGFSQENYRFKRPYFLEDIRSNTALLEKHVHAVRYNTSKHPLRRIRPYYYYGWYQLAKRFPGIRKSFRKNEQKFLRHEGLLQLLKQQQPKLVISTYPVNLLEASMLYNASTLAHCKTVIHLLSWDNITTKGHFPALADEYIVWGPVMEKELRDFYGVEQKHVHSCGVPHFDLHYEVSRAPDPAPYLQSLGLDPQIPYVYFAMSAPRFGPREIDIVEWIAAKVESGAWGAIQFIARPHPQNVTGNMADQRWVERLKALDARKGVAVDWPQLAKSETRWSMEMNDMWRLSHLLAGAAVTLNSGSTVSIDAMLHNRPVIITSFDATDSLEYWRSARRLIDFEHLRKLISFGGATVVKKFDELEAAVQHYLKDPSWNEEGRKKTVREECFEQDGRSTERVMAALLQMVK